ncbi:thioredoxin-disulfide reductase [Sinanaerobacter chloroacetimidivorans]|uniref:Thioredoxin reductase n=1 Tax=Sinanaerobacter chloroacetimidivorans TaxID=2818044 RepID=A0A8J7W0I1_9FIRM|nr:thioredoxin-disulfide reductase [Sinanaerobacter chloroacetimidivorans]MBR0598532.1 thioredoxin-disulfide reductase [Sinanaerobacter chloroacetimidivorans]
MKIYDLIIIGAGPAGLSAGIYAGRAMLDTLIIEKDLEGGQILQTSEIENYPGSLDIESGPTLIDRMIEQVKKFGVDKVRDTVVDVALDGEIKAVKCDKETYHAKTIVIAGGASAVPIGVEGEEKFRGRGLSYCATCDGPFFRGLNVYVVGGGDSAIQEALYLTKFAKKVTVIHRRQELRAAKSIQEKAFRNEKIDFMLDTVIKEIHGSDVIEGMTLENVKDGKITEIKADPNDGTFGVFGFVGYKPKSDLYSGKLHMENGYIITDENMRTNIPGVFAAGDIRKKSLRQVVTAVADGAIAAVQAEKYIEALKS